MTILITGTTGFVGANLNSFLAKQGHQIIEVNRTAKSGTYTFDELLNGDFHADIWIHLASKAKDKNENELLEQYVAVNVELSQKVFKAFIKDPSASTFIYFSTVKAAASIVDGVLTEECEKEVDVPYGLSKRLAEKALLGEKLPKGKKLIILRPALIYGYNTNSNLYSLYKFVKRGIPYPFAAFDNKRTMISIDNLAFVILNIIKNPSFKAGIYNVADDDAISTNELTTLIRESMGKKPLSMKIPRGLIKFMFRCGDWLHLPINTQTLNKLTDDYIVSNAKLKSELGVPLPVSARDSLKSLFDSFQRAKI
jgi:nucleoside-diphosphate-sugar epimerase